MGYIAHDAVVAVFWEPSPSIEEFRKGLDPWAAAFILGPVEGINGYISYVFLPDGSKEGWGHSNDAQRLRETFFDLATRHGDAIYVRFGGDWGSERGTTIMGTTDEKTPVAPL